MSCFLVSLIMGTVLLAVSIVINWVALSRYNDLATTHKIMKMRLQRECALADQEMKRTLTPDKPGSIWTTDIMTIITGKNTPDSDLDDGDLDGLFGPKHRT